VDQSRELLNPDRTVFEEIAEGAEEVSAPGSPLGGECPWVSSRRWVPLSLL
jgi:hypothetical protein